MSAMSSATLSFVNKRQFLTLIQPVVPPHECADLALVESAMELIILLLTLLLLRLLLLSLMLSLFILLLTLLVLMLF
jgi:hypothetical protein